MKKFVEDENGQLILIACISVVIAIVLVVTYQYSTMWSGENSINRENVGSFYFYQGMKDKYINIINESRYFNLSNPDNITVFENEYKQFALLHGYSIDFIRNEAQVRIIFIDKDVKIDEIINI